MIGFCLLAAMAVPHATAELILPVMKVEAGKPFWVGVKLTMHPGWHTYWANPGDAGVATTVDWTLPKGWKAGPLHWPVPKATKMGVDTIYGYEGSVILPVQITPKSASQGPLAANVKWLACEKECVSENQKLSGSIPTQIMGDDPTKDLKLTIDELPKASKEVSALAIANAKKQVLLTVTNAPKQFTFFPFDDSFEASMDRPQQDLGDAVQLTLQISEFKAKKPTRVKGVLVAPEGSKWPGGAKAIWIDVPIS